MKQKLLFPLVLFFFLFSSLIFSQTAGSSIVSSIESKAAQIEKNDESVVDLNRQHLASYSEEQNKFYELKMELDALHKEKAQAMAEMRRGEFCRGCDRTATQLRNAGITNVMQHFYDNGGTYSATPEQLNAKEAEYDKMIADKEEEIRKFTEEKNEFSKKRDQLSEKMDKLQEDNDRLRREIEELSEKFKDKILEEAKSLHNTCGASLMAIVANKHYTEDQINILQVKIADLAQEEAKALADFEDKLRRKNQQEILDLENKVSLAQDRGMMLEQDHNNRLQPLNRDLFDLKRRLQEIELALKYETLSEQKIEELTKEKENITARITSTEQQVNDQISNYDQRAGELKQEIATLNEKIWNLKTTAFSDLLQEGLANLKKAFLTRRTIFNDALASKKDALQDIGSLLQSKKEEFRQKNIEYTSKVDAERIRMMRACSTAGASCAGTDTVGAVNMNWSKVSGCVGEMEGAHNSGDPVYGCEEQSASYLEHYQSRKSGMSDADREALSRTNTRSRYDLILNKITN